MGAVFGCEATIYRAEFERNQYVCPKCGHHERINAADRINILLDQAGRSLIATEVVSEDPLKFKDTKKYKDRLVAAQKKTGENEALRVERGTIGIPVVVAAFEFGFIGGSMGISVGKNLSWVSRKQ